MLLRQPGRPKFFYICKNHYNLRSPKTENNFRLWTNWLQTGTPQLPPIIRTHLLTTGNFTSFQLLLFILYTRRDLYRFWQLVELHKTWVMVRMTCICGTYVYNDHILCIKLNNFYKEQCLLDFFKQAHLPRLKKNYIIST